MSEKSIAQNAETPTEYIAASLRTMAACIEPLGTDLWVSVSIQPRHHDGNEGQRIAAVDAVATALFGYAGKPHEMSSESWHHDAGGNVGTVSVSVLCGITAPELAAKDAEIARLRAELEAAELLSQAMKDGAR